MLFLQVLAIRTDHHSSITLAAFKLLCTWFDTMTGMDKAQQLRHAFEQLEVAQTWPYMSLLSMSWSMFLKSYPHSSHCIEVAEPCDWTFTISHYLTSSAWENWLKRFGDSHRIHHFHMAMIKGIIYTNLAIFIPFIIATWKWWFLWPSPNLFSHFSHVELVNSLYVIFHTNVENRI